MALDKKTMTIESTLNRSGRKYPVKLRVYDISQGAARTWSPILLGRTIEGVWHSGVEVYGYEYFYGGGIVKMKPENVESTFGIQPTRVHNLGHTDLTKSQFEKYLISIKPMFRKEVYDLVNWNCNHFTDHAARHLVSKPIPGYISDLPKEICGTFMGKMLMMFIRMTQGGSAPVAVNDPQHPSKFLEASPPSGGREKPQTSASGTRARRYSCPASPTHVSFESGALTSRPLHTAGDFKAAGLDVPQRAQTASGAVTQRACVRRQHRLRTAPDSNALRSARPLPPDCGAAPMSVSLAEIARPRVSFCPGDEILGPVTEDELERVPGGSIGVEETAVVLSPKHRRLYELQCSRVAPARSHKSLRMSVGRASRPDRNTPSPLEPLLTNKSTLSASSLRPVQRTVPLQTVAPE
eukprot:Gregarina_sp_Pseudo_9__425@NODE_1277_length_1721_cov_107_445303_g1200_i0_p1_GENE_NODE_1277_length_1721_cov_107_445303_g1200_i0NODE_1277_length_1721_cov_107_445303_g1200_i0_p1_ORF_typecomplete_len409_score59_39Peptidase_C97/PF05903_14/3_2e36tRNAsynt_2e/PF02091_15/0_23_NODE_1277_length_1721_cov_107_445303_g1200_i01651391